MRRGLGQRLGVSLGIPSQLDPAVQRHRDERQQRTDVRASDAERDRQRDARDEPHRLLADHAQADALVVADTLQRPAQ